jgi:prolipoprotein diacylglyceryltransferase
MCPYLKLGLYTISMHTLFNTIAFITGIVYYIIASGRQGLKFFKALVFSACLAVSLAIGVELHHLIIAIPNALKNNINLLKVLEGSKVMGGIAMGSFCVYIYTKKAKMSTLLYMDIYFFIMPVLQSIGRIGCVMGGCCHGKQIPSPNGIRILNVTYSRYPTQLMEIAFNLILFLFLILLKRKTVKNGYIAVTYLICYGLYRTFAEFLRGDYESYKIMLYSNQLMAVK